MIWSQILIDSTHLWILALAYGFLLHELGILTLGHSGLLLAGAYGYALVAIGQWRLEGGLALVAAVVTLLGLSALRVRGDIFTVLSFAFAESLRYLALGLISVTGGANGLGPIDRPPWLANDGSALTTALCVAGLGVAAYVVFASGRWGMRAGSLRDDELLARAYGVSSQPIKFLAVAATGLVVSIVGMLQVAYFGLAVPRLGNIDVSLQSIAAAMLALPLWRHGRPWSTVLGLACGAVVLTILPPLLRSLWNAGPDVAVLRQFAFGGALYALVHPRSPFSKIRTQFL